MRLLKLSTAVNIMVFMTDSADHISGKASLTLTITSSQAGGAFGSISPTVTDRGSGWYELALTTSHTNTLGDLAIHITATGADPTDFVNQVVTDLPGDTVASVTGNVSGNVVGTVASVVGNVGGNVVGSVASVTATVSANLTQILGTALTETSGLLAAGFKKFFNVSSPTGTVNSLPDAVAGAAGGLFIAGTNAATTITTALTTTFTGNLTGSVASVTAGVTLAASAVQAIWDALTSALTTTGSIGKLLVTNIDATISSRLASGSYTSPPSAATIAQAVWDALTSALTTVGSIGKLLVTDIDGTISSRAPASTAVSNADYTSARATKIDNLDTTVSSRLATSGYTAPDNADIASIKAKTDNLPATPAAAGDAMTLTSGERTTLAGVIWASLTSALTTAGSVGKLIVDNVNATIASRLPTSSYTAPDNTSITAIKAKTDNLPATPSSQGDVTTVGTAVAAVDTLATAIKAKTDNLPTGPAAITVPKNQALSNFPFPMYLSTGDPAPGLTIIAKRSIDGGAFANCPNTAVEIGDGWYKINLASSDLNGKLIAFEFFAVGALTTKLSIITENPA